MKPISFLRLFTMLAVLSLFPFQPAGGNQNPQEISTQRETNFLRRIIEEGSYLDYRLPDHARISLGLDAVSSVSKQENPEAPDYGEPPPDTRFAINSLINDKWAISTMHLDGTIELTLYTGDGTSGQPNLSRNGQRIAFASDWLENVEIFAINQDGTAFQRLTDNPASDMLPAWSADGSKIAFQSNRYGSSDIFVMNVDGSSLIQLTAHSAYDGQPAWSPDGSQIVFVSNRTGLYELWVMNANGSNQHPITKGADAYKPAWSPDGQLIAFSNDSDRNGFYELWLLDPEGSRPRLIADSYSETWAPSWGPDGNWLAYLDTSWIIYQGDYYWIDSKVVIKDIRPSGQTITLHNQDTVWQVTWASTDTQPPAACQVDVLVGQGFRGAQIPLRFSAQDQGSSGIVAYDGQFRQPGGQWQNLVSWIRSNGALGPSSEYKQTEFRCRAYDFAGAVGPWSATPAIGPVSDFTAPTSSVLGGHSFVRGSSASLTWGGADKGSGINTFDIYNRQVRSGQPESNWQIWKANQPGMQSEFSGVPGNTYYFHSQATDKFGHKEPWNPQAQAVITLYKNTLTTRVSDCRGNTLPASIAADPPAAYVQAQNEPNGPYLLYLGSSPVHNLTVESGLSTSPLTAHLSTLADSHFHWAVCDPEDQFLNGGFETGLTNGWQHPEEGVTVVEHSSHTGAYGLEISNPLTTTLVLTTQLFVANTLTNPTLSFFYKIAELPQTGKLRVEISGLPKPLIEDAAASNDWQHAWFDLSHFQGQEITLALKLEGQAARVQFDEFSLTSWKTPLPKSVSPNSWSIGEATTLILQGENFSPTAAIYLGKHKLTPITYHGPTMISVHVPANLPEGDYDLQIHQSSLSSVLPKAIAITSRRVYLPFSLVQSSNKDRLPNSGWPLAAQDSARTSYNQAEAGGSRYSFAWSADNPDGYDCFPSVPIVSDGVLLLSCGMRLRAFNAETGQALWEKRFESFPGLPTVESGRVYISISPYPSVTYALDLYSGAEKWKVEQDGKISPLVIDNLIINSTNDDWLYSLNAATGVQEWSKLYYQVSNSSNTSLAYANGLAFAWLEGSFYAHNPHSGGYAWRVDTGYRLDGIPLTYPTIWNNFAALPIPYGVIVFDLVDQNPAWSYHHVGAQRKVWLAAAEGVLYAAYNGELQARKITDGTLLWKNLVNDRLEYGPVLTANYVYASSSDHTYIFDRATGQEVWRINQGGNPVIANGFLYLYNLDSLLLAFRAEEP